MEYNELASGFTGRELGPMHMGYAEAVRQLRQGEDLYAVHDQVVRKVAVFLPDEAAYRRTDEQYGMGLSVRYFFAAAPQHNVDVIVDGDAEAR